ncbi:class I SAM-dependent methyltransferase [Caulobacter rhizosphaerae]|uniref:class I SAM-dependent methyltransferase n=2 Tax=Caulobacter rhizosphaerae TaxID=2010972 RepID=UPI001E4E479C|nr:class I SAM-dependent methyltransferase [Caulobacter rhizosphaerae]
MTRDRSLTFAAYCRHPRRGMQPNSSRTSPTLDFTSDWFSGDEVWRSLLTRYQPRRFLEIGSYEGRAACFLIQERARQRPIELHCIDTWLGGVEHEPSAMSAVEARFDHNIALAVSGAVHRVDFHKHKSQSKIALWNLLAAGKADYFDFIYVDGSHQAPDALSDAVMSFHLLRPGGLLIFDDYLWSMEDPGRQDFYNMPKPAIDAFVNIFQRKLQVLGAPLYQLYVRKISS